MSDAVAIGKQLLAARERQGLSVAQVAGSLRVDVAVIDSLEAGRFFALGAPVFARGYLRHYAELLGESLEEVTGRYQALQESSTSPNLAAVSQLASQPNKRRARWPLLLLAALLVLGALVWWAMGVKTA